MKFYILIKKITDQLFGKYLLITNTTLGIVLIGAGDVVQQNIEKKIYPEKKYDKKRTGNMMLAGCGFGILGHYWYKFLDTKLPGHATKTVAKKLLAEMVLGPPLLLGYFLAMGWLEKKPTRDCIQEFKENLVVILAADWAIYAPLQAVNFFYIPPKYRFLYVCSLCFAYDVFLSYIIHKEDNKKLYGKAL